MKVKRYSNKELKKQNKASELSVFISAALTLLCLALMLECNEWYYLFGFTLFQLIFSVCLINYLETQICLDVRNEFRKLKAEFKFKEG